MLLFIIIAAVAVAILLMGFLEITIPFTSKKLKIVKKPLRIGKDLMLPTIKIIKKDKQYGGNRSEIDINDAAEVDDVHRQFPGVPHQQVLNAINEKGPSRQAVMDHLRNKSGTG